MKFVSAVTALIAAFSVGAEAAKKNRVSRRELNQRMKKGQFNKATLMAGAKPHSADAKKRALGGNNDDGFILSSYNSIQFQSCFSLTTSYEEAFEGDDNTMLSLFSQGAIMPLESYAVFKICYGDNCSGSSLEYVVDLNTYVQALINYLPDQMDGFCEACKQNAESCQAMLYGNYGGQYGGNRKLSDFQERMLEKSQLVRQLDCNLCAEYNCLDDDDNNNEDGFEQAAEWLGDITECKETGIQYQGGYQEYNGQYYQNQNDKNEGAELFAGIICNGDGSGLEIGMFYDEDCKVYLPKESFSDYMSYYDATYQDMTKEIIEYTFSEKAFSCKEQEIVYTLYDVNQYNGRYGYNYNNNWNNDEDEISEYCEGIVNGETTPVDLSTCGSSYNNYNNNYNQKYQNYDGGNYGYQYDWYTFEISEEYSLDMSSVCSAVKKAGEYHTYYNTELGSTYSYASSSAADEFIEVLESESTFGFGLSGAAKFGIVALVGVIGGALAALYMKFKDSSGDDKNSALIEPEVATTEFEAA